MHNFGEGVPDLVFAFAMLLLAGFLIAVARAQRAAVMFAAFVAVRGLSNIDGLLAIHDSTVAQTVFVVDAATELGVTFFALGFLLLYPRVRKPATKPWVWLTLAAVPLACVALLATFPKWYAVLLAVEGGGYRMARFDWLARVMDAQWAAYSLIAVMLAWEFARQAPSPLRNGLLLVSTAWGLESVRVAIRAGHAAFARTEAKGDGWASVAVQRADNVFDALGASVVLVAIWILWRALRSPGELQRRAIGFALAAYGASTVLGGLQIVDQGQVVGTLTLSHLANSVLRVAIPLLVGYALVRFQVFDLDLKIRWTLKQSTVAAAFVAVFFGVSELAQQIFSENVGPYVGVAATTILVFFLSPLQRFADRVASAALPHARPLARQTRTERASLYREQARIAWSDGKLTAKDRRMLNVARDRLSLSVEETARLEHEVAPA